MLTKFGEGFNKYEFEEENRHSGRISTFVANNFYQVCERKASYISTLSKKNAQTTHIRFQTLMQNLSEN